MMKPWIVALACALWSCLSFAQEFPSRALRLVVPFPPGGSTDIVARAIQPGLSQRLGQSVVIEHKPGAGSSIGLEMVARSPADGHTIVLVSPNLVVNPHLYKLGFDPMKDLVPVTQAVQSYYILVVNNALPARTVADVVALAKAQPDKLTYGSWGVGAHSHLAGELLDRSAGVRTVHVPYKGSVLALADLMGGQITMMFDVLSTAMPQIRAAKLRAIAVAGSQRSPQLPEVPTVGETLPGYSVEGWLGFLAPAGTPPQVVARLQRDIAASLLEPAIQQRLQEAGYGKGATPTEDFARLLKSDYEKYGQLIRERGIKAE
jgi:tripartite-type tricarboxylate transporter receptor subunit TctC